MSKAEELARKLSDMTSAFKTPSHGRGVMNGAIEELRRLAQVERELEDLKASIGEPVAWIVEGQTLGGGVSQYLSWSKSGAGQVPAPLRTEPTPLYAIKEVK